MSMPIIVRLERELAELDAASDTSFGRSISAAVRGVEEAAGRLDAATERLRHVVKHREEVAAAIAILIAAENAQT